MSLKPGWSSSREQYVCADNVVVAPRQWPVLNDYLSYLHVAQNGVTYIASPEPRTEPVYVVPSGAYMNRSMYYVYKVIHKLRTFASPRSTG